MKKVIAILLLFLVASQLVTAGMKDAAWQQELLLEFEEKTDGDKAGKDIKPEKKEGKECLTHTHFLQDNTLVLVRCYSVDAFYFVPFPLFEKSTPPPDTTC